MAYNYEYPYVDSGQLNVDWILATIKTYTEKIDSLDLDSVTEQLNKVEEDITSLQTLVNQNGSDIKTVTKKVEELNTDLTDLTDSIELKFSYIDSEIDGLQELLNDIKKGKYVDLYIESIDSYLRLHISDYLDKVAKYVIFGLDDDGYFFASIPQSWNELLFSTGTDNFTANYGHLILKY